MISSKRNRWNYQDLWKQHEMNFWEYILFLYSLFTLFNANCNSSASRALGISPFILSSLSKDAEEADGGRSKVTPPISSSSISSIVISDPNKQFYNWILISLSPISISYSLIIGNGYFIHSDNNETEQSNNTKRIVFRFWESIFEKIFLLGI